MEKFIKFFILGATLICAQLIGAGGAGGAGADDDALITAVMHQAPDHGGLVSALTSQEKLNSFIAERAVVIFYDLNHSGRFRCPDPDEEQAEVIGTPSVLWTTTTAHVGHDRSPSLVLVANKHIAPSTALLQLYSKGGVINSSIARSLVETMILLEIVGDANFNKIFKGSELQLPNQNCFGMIEIGFGTPNSSGTFGYITNVHTHRVMDPTGLENGYNIFCIGENADGKPLYSGFGDFLKAPKTETATLTFLYQALISLTKPSSNAIMDRTVQYMQSKYASDPDSWNTVRSRLQTKYPIYMFDINLLKRILYGVRVTTTPVLEAQDEAVPHNPELEFLLSQVLRMQRSA